MDPKSNKKYIPAELSLAAFISAGLTLVISLTYIVLCVLALAYRWQCDVGMLADASGDSYFLLTLYRVYLQVNTCANSLSPPEGVQLVSSDTVYIFVLIVLCGSVLSFAAAIALIVIVAQQKSGLVFATVWTYSSVCVACLVADLTFGVFFGIDFSEMTLTMENTFPGIGSNYMSDVLRLGSLLFMAISLKGLLAPVLNIILVIVLAVSASKFRRKLQTDEHSIHKVGAINAYEQQQVNRGFMGDEEPRRSPRNPLRAAPSQVNTLPLTPLSDYSNPRDFDRSNSWQHSPASAPFSYMEEPRRPRTGPAAEPQWRRDPWPPAPPMPAPDYSPPSRRLKSVLKPNYM